MIYFIKYLEYFAVAVVAGDFRTLQSPGNCIISSKSLGKFKYQALGTAQTSQFTLLLIDESGGSCWWQIRVQLEAALCADGEQGSLMLWKEKSLVSILVACREAVLAKVWVLQINRWEMHSGEGFPLVAFFFFCFQCHETCGILVPWSGIELKPSAVTAWSPNHWITRKFSGEGILNFSHSRDVSVYKFFLLVHIETLFCFNHVL